MHQGRSENKSVPRRRAKPGRSILSVSLNGYEKRIPQVVAMKEFRFMSCP